ncbi:MAG TPA: phosphatidylserine decarboxylase [Alphaproteobacteria bacterium]
MAGGNVAHFFKHINAAGWPFIAAFACVSILLGLIASELLWLGLVLTAWCVYFFRDPIRVTPDQPDLIIAPADGMVSAIEKVTLPQELNTESTALVTRVSIFLNVFDVHVQRVPVSGTIKKVIYRPGKFINATLDKASDDNERSTVLMETTSGKQVAFVQIAGLIARRIINTLKADQAVTAGERYGLIRFGSRVDVYLPEGINPHVIVGQRMIGGETIIADLNNAISARTGIAR